MPINAAQYLAANPDLLRAGITVQTAEFHYNTYGSREGRSTTFDALSYEAANPDLISAFSTNTDAALNHYITYGYLENRSTSFNAASYEAANADLIRAFGSDTNAALLHYVTTGYREGRSTTFNASGYVQSNSDLSRAGLSGTSAILHYITYGFRENRIVPALTVTTSTSTTATAPSSSGSVSVRGTDGIYWPGASSASGGATLPPWIDLPSTATSIVLSASGSVMFNHNTGDNWNNPDGVGAAVSSSSINGRGAVSGLTAPYAGYLVGVFLGSGGATGIQPTSLNFRTSTGGTSFTQLSPQLNQTFFIGDGVTGNGSGSAQIFNIPRNATALYLGLSDAPNYNGSPGAYEDNLGTFSVAYAVRNAQGSIIPNVQSHTTASTSTPTTSTSSLIDQATQIQNSSLVYNTLLNVWNFGAPPAPRLSEAGLPAPYSVNGEGSLPASGLLAAVLG